MLNYPSFANRQTVISGLGLAALNGTIYYMSAAGSQPACKSVWATLVARNARSGITAERWEGYRDLFGDERLKTFWSPLPNTSTKHFVSVSQRDNLILVINPEGAKPDANTHALRGEARAEARERFHMILKNRTPAPVLPEWIPAIWQATIDDKNYFEHLRCYGDAMLGYLVKLDANWTAVVQKLVKEQIVTF